MRVEGGGRAEWGAWPEVQPSGSSSQVGPTREAGGRAGPGAGLHARGAVLGGHAHGAHRAAGAHGLRRRLPHARHPALRAGLPPRLPGPAQGEAPPPARARCPVRTQPLTTARPLPRRTCRCCSCAPTAAWRPWTPSAAPGPCCPAPRGAWSATLPPPTRQRAASPSSALIWEVRRQKDGAPGRLCSQAGPWRASRSAG